MAAYILAIDDGHFIRRMITLILETAGYRIETAEDGSAGLKLIEQEQPDLVITDIIMPGISGIDLAKQLASDKRTQTIPILILSAIDSGQDAALQSQLDAMGFYQLEKPFNPQQLLEAVQSILADHQVMKE
jgi:CheY-like chemotaxis protein